MIGPSSSHTAGAARLAKVSCQIAEDDIREVKFLFMDPLVKLIKAMVQIGHWLQEF